jgi:dienelactone hydrolase
MRCLTVPRKTGKRASVLAQRFPHGRRRESRPRIGCFLGLGWLWLGWIGLGAASVSFAEVPTTAAPWYADRANLLSYQDEQGKLQPVKTPADWAQRVAHLRANMELVMGPLPAPSKLPLDLQVEQETALRHYTRQHVTFTVEEGDRLPGWLLIPHGATAQDRRPAMLCLPGSSAPGKDTPAGLTAQATSAYGHELAERGYVCLVLDYPLTHTAEYKTDPYALKYASATMKGVVNHRRGIDVLTSLPFVRPDAIGVIGHSLGGHNSLFLAIFDDRVRAIVSSCGFNVFAKHAGGDVRAWSSRYYMPRIKTVYGDDPARIPFDFTEVLAALAPRPVFVNAPLHDEPDFEVSGVVDCFTAALPVYRDLFQAADRLVVQYPDAGHTFPVAQRLAAYAFLDQQLSVPSQAAPPIQLERDLLAHWPFRGNARESVRGVELGQARGNVVFDAVDAQAGAQFQGSGNWWEIPAHLAPTLGWGDFSLATWVHCDEDRGFVTGDLLSQYDTQRKRGFHLTLKSASGVTTNQANWRHLQFGIDDQRGGKWQDRGRPGNAILAFALAVHEGALYAGTCEPEVGQSGRVYRYVGEKNWIDCGAPDQSNSVTSMAVYQGQLYVGTGKYRVAGSSLKESENTELGGRVFRYAGGKKWVDCGQLPETEAIGGLVVFRGQLYASSLYRPAGFFRYEKDQTWSSLPVPDGPDATTGNIVAKRVEALCMHDGYLYASSYDGGDVYRFDGEKWLACGRLGENTQTYSFASYDGRLYVGTWPSGRVYRFEKPGEWTDVGRLGEELEVMGMQVHNGRLLAGTLPLAEVYEYQGETTWKRLTQLDHTPDVRYRRAWTMAEHDGQLFCATLPSGTVFATTMGQQVAWGQPLSTGWHHVTATKSADRLTLYVDGIRVAQSPIFAADAFQLQSDAPWRLGAGMNGTLNGQLKELRVYRRVLNANEIKALAKP